MKIYPLGDSALTIEFGEIIDEKINQEVLSLFHSLKNDPVEGILDIVPAYSSLTIYYRINGINSFQLMSGLIKEIIAGKTGRREALPALPPSRQVKIPVCYSRQVAPDLEETAELLNLSTDRLVTLHAGRKYRVYMLGFLPGFPYMGITDPTIEVQRKPEPVMVKAGSVGIAGNQTGIYPLDSPGGWQIIGRTPLKLFDPLSDSPCLFSPGDEVEFYPISHEEFENYQTGNS
jgi:inhibitor of KinA